MGSTSAWDGAILRGKGRPIVKYRDFLPWAVQKRLNRSRCRLGYGFGLCTRVGRRKHVLDGARSPMRRGNYYGKEHAGICPAILCRELCKNGYWYSFESKKSLSVKTTKQENHSKHKIKIIEKWQRQLKTITTLLQFCEQCCLNKIHEFWAVVSGARRDRRTLEASTSIAKEYICCKMWSKLVKRTNRKILPSHDVIIIYLLFIFTLVQSAVLP